MKKILKVALFGISRSGKDYTISDFIETARSNGIEFVHASPMNMIRERLGNKKLKNMSIGEKEKLVSVVREEINEIAKKSNLIVDEHYCYPSTFSGVKLENGYYDEKLPHRIISPTNCSTDYEVVFPNYEIGKYDYIAYMDIEPSIILERFRTSEGCKQNLLITENEIKEWMAVEKEKCVSMNVSENNVQFIRNPKISGYELFQGINSAFFKK